MLDVDLCKQILKLQDPWQVVKIEMDAPSNRLDIHLGFQAEKKRGLFRSAGQQQKLDCGCEIPDPIEQTSTVRHLNMADLRTYLHVPTPGTIGCNSPDCSLSKTWATAGSHFSREMEQYVADAMQYGKSFQAASQITGVGIHDAREICERIGVVAQDMPTAESQGGANEGDPTVSPIRQQTKKTIRIPPETSNSWWRIINGELALDTNAVGLKMLIQRIRISIGEQPSDSKKLAGARVLRQYFLKHGRRHIQELRRIAKDVNASSQGTPVGSMAMGSQAVDIIPVEGHPNWLKLIEGDIPLKTRSVGLKMMLERIRISIQQKPADSTRTAGVKILRQFFLKHRHAHAAELSQISGLPQQHFERQAQDISNIVVPPENDPAWLRLIKGEIQLKTDVVGLKMMIERVRILHQNKPSEASRLAGTKLLRQYFLKHQRKHRAELAQMKAA